MIESTLKKSQVSKKKLLNACLEIIGANGLSGVTFRAVATKADLPLGLTSYYFKNKDAMLIEAYYLFHESSMVPVNQFVEKISLFLAQMQPYDLKKQPRTPDFIEQLTQITTAYIKAQVVDHAMDRKIAAAFMHAAIVDPMIRELVAQRQDDFIAMGEGLLRELGVSEPRLVSNLFLSLTNHVEKQLLLENKKRFDQQTVDTTFKHFFSAVL